MLDLSSTAGTDSVVTGRLDGVVSSLVFVVVSRSAEVVGLLLAFGGESVVASDDPPPQPATSTSTTARTFVKPEEVFIEDSVSIRARCA
ncbi:MAG: hypothetical protein OEX04_02755 [Acidimicrobiia bacterium]|nr:hypothetical protein [Acidimicrobiia bacterium]MDH5294330.1 hypothetical protein [Acidimicrobiia bacterium]